MFIIRTKLTVFDAGPQTDAAGPGTLRPPSQRLARCGDPRQVWRHLAKLKATVVEIGLDGRTGHKVAETLFEVLPELREA